MDALNWKILQVLDWNGRVPTNKIAKKVHSSKEVVSYRIKKLESKGIIRRYFPVINMFKLGYHTSRLYFDLEELNQKEEKDFLEFLDKDINVGLIFRMDHPYKYGVLVWTKSIYEIEEIMKRIKEQLGKAIIKQNYTLFCSYKLYPKDYLFGNKFHETNLLMEPSEKINYDRNDFSILKELAKDARATTVQISETLGIPQTTVSNKIKNMEKQKVIIGYRADIDYTKLGFMNYFLEIYLDENYNLKEIEGWADACKNVVWLQKVIGTCDIEIEVELKDRVELEMLLNDLRSKFSNIRKIIFWSQEYKKFTFMPKS